jgi:hypothetical protein
LIGLIAHVVGTCHDQAWQRARSRRTRFTCDAASRAPASLIRSRGSGGSARRSSSPPCGHRPVEGTTCPCTRV